MGNDSKSIPVHWQVHFLGRTFMCIPMLKKSLSNSTWFTTTAFSITATLTNSNRLMKMLVHDYREHFKDAHFWGIYLLNSDNSYVPNYIIWDVFKIWKFSRWAPKRESSIIFMFLTEAFLPLITSYRSLQNWTIIEMLEKAYLLGISTFRTILPHWTCRDNRSTDHCQMQR